jgi:hypothetical protein
MRNGHGQWSGALLTSRSVARNDRLERLFRALRAHRFKEF